MNPSDSTQEPKKDELQPFSPTQDEDEDGFRASLQKDDATRKLVESAHGGDVEALNELFARYHGFMVEIARRRLGPKLKLKEEADDLAQTTFREATRDFGRYEYRGENSLLRWLMQILHNKIRDKAEYYAAGKRDVSRERTMEPAKPSADDTRSFHEPAADDLSVTRVVQRNEEFEIVREALEDLSPDHRKAITLVFFQGLTLRQAGEQMDGRTEDAVRMLLRRAEKRVRELTQAKLGS
ncbi:MAG: sigma-70 family RNA polymerase sigma factor [Planctomycetota bacterium]